jgi:hypothetical protein
LVVRKKEHLMTRRLPCALFALLGALAFGAGPASAQSYDPELQKRSQRTDGHFELRPLSGALIPFNSLTSQTVLIVGLDAYIPITTALSFELGGWGGGATDLRAANFHAGLKFRWIDFHSVVIPFVSAGLQHTWGFPYDAAKNRNTITGAGAHVGMGFDFVATDRIRPGIQVMFEFGPKILPNAGVFANGQVTFGVTFVL